MMMSNGSGNADSDSGEQAFDETTVLPPEELPEAEAESSPDAAEQLEAAESRADENHALYLRAAAELENVRKRASRDVEKARKFGAENLAQDLLEVADNLERGLEAGQTATPQALLDGTQATLKLLRAALIKAGVEEVDPEGEPFDPELHEAMTMQPSETAEPGSVIAVIQKGYQLNGRLLRPARVVVAGEPEG